jgi:hypothetical protein
MDLKKHKLIVTVFLFAITAFAIHKLLFFLFVPSDIENNFIYSLPILYGFFFSCSTVIIFILLKVKEKSLDNVGFTFLLLTSVKMVASYVFLQPILNSNLQNSTEEKINFFIIFILFLAIETLVSIRILNNKQ